MRILSLFIGILLSCSSVAAETAVPPSSKAPIATPHEKVAVVTVQLLTLIENAKGYFEKDPKRFYGEIEKLVDPLIDFPTFARGVMGSYGTKDYYQSLATKAEKDAFKSNYDRFVKTFKEGLINTYGKGLLAFNGEKTEIVPPTNEDKELVSKGRAVDVMQTVQGKDQKYSIVYKMRKDKQGEWMLQNVTIETINVGLLYRNQFNDSMAKYHDDFGKVVDNWTVKPQNTEKPKEVAIDETKK